jgi:hypothetical protein
MPVKLNSKTLFKKNIFRLFEPVFARLPSKFRKSANLSKINLLCKNKNGYLRTQKIMLISYPLKK